MDKMILKFIRKCKGLKITKTILQKKDKIGGFTFPDFKSYYKATVIKTCGTGIRVHIQNNTVELRVQK